MAAGSRCRSYGQAAGRVHEGLFHGCGRGVCESTSGKGETDAPCNCGARRCSQEHHSRRHLTVERSTRYLMLVHLPRGHSVLATRNALAATVQSLPPHLWLSLTWDQRVEVVAAELNSRPRKTLGEAPAERLAKATGISQLTSSVETTPQIRRPPGIGGKTNC